MGSLISKLFNSKIYGFTPDKYTDSRGILNIVEEQLKNGVDIIQLREKKMCDKKKLELAFEIKKLTEYYKKLFIVNDDILIAKISNADGVHLGQDDLDLKYARKILGPNKIIGISTHNFEQYKKAQESIADYTAIGPIFPTKTKDNPAPVVMEKNLDNILSVKKKFTVGIGGINFSNLHKIITYKKIDCIAIISAIINGNITSNLNKINEIIH